MPPAHLHCQPGDVAPYVLLPGDPDRATRIAQGHLRDARLVTDHRRMYGYTGTFEGIPVTVQTTGMGSPSAAIVTEELAMLGAKAVLRVGSCGTLQPGIALGDLVVATAACSLNGTTDRIVGLPGYSPAADFHLVRHAWERAHVQGVPIHTGLVGTCDVFYERDQRLLDTMRSYAVLAFEMEAGAIFTIAARERMRAGCLLYVSDLVASGEHIAPEARAAAEDRMAEVALGTFAALHRSQA